jgi:hypothetical protein
MVERAAHARAVKEAKREAKTVQVGISDLVPEKVSEKFEHRTLRWRADDVINSLSVTQARELYDRLKQIFGG